MLVIVAAWHFSPTLQQRQCHLLLLLLHPLHLYLDQAVELLLHCPLIHLYLDLVAPQHQPLYLMKLPQQAMALAAAVLIALLVLYLDLAHLNLRNIAQ
jgi:hypothetical protein